MHPDESDSTHFWIYCPGCAYEGKLGVPKNHPSDAVVCPQCRSVVNVKPEDRILWEPAKGEFWERQIGESVSREHRARESIHWARLLGRRFRKFAAAFIWLSLFALAIRAAIAIIRSG